MLLPSALLFRNLDVNVFQLLSTGATRPLLQTMFTTTPPPPPLPPEHCNSAVKSVRYEDEDLCRKLTRLISNRGKFSWLQSNKALAERKETNKQIIDEVCFPLQVKPFYYDREESVSNRLRKEISFLLEICQTLASQKVNLRPCKDTTEASIKRKMLFITLYRNVFLSYL